ncbi:MAG: hypothetical protein L6R42_005658, partial [Xanthoria sp. 1 TBL-2021]
THHFEVPDSHKLRRNPRKRPIRKPDGDDVKQGEKLAEVKTPLCPNEQRIPSLDNRMVEFISAQAPKVFSVGVVHDDIRD